MTHERPQGIFSDLHREDGRVHVTLLHDPNVEGLDVALYLDGSASMKDEYGRYPKGHKLWSFLFGGTYRMLAEAVQAPEEWRQPNVVEPEARRMLEYLAGKDRNGRLRVAYWACGEHGNAIEALGELGREEAPSFRFPGPKEPGRATYLTPALRDYLWYFKTQEAARGLAVVISDGALYDPDQVMAVTESEAAHLPINFVLVGVGSQVNEEQLETLSHRTYGGREHVWCHRIAREIDEIAQLVAVLVDETMTVAGGGTIYDDRGKVIRVYEGGLPAVLDFPLDPECRSFTLEINGQRFTQAV